MKEWNNASFIIVHRCPILKILLWQCHHFFDRPFQNKILASCKSCRRSRSMTDAVEWATQKAAGGIVSGEINQHWLFCIPIQVGPATEHARNMRNWFALIIVPRQIASERSFQKSWFTPPTPTLEIRVFNNFGQRFGHLSKFCGLIFFWIRCFDLHIVIYSNIYNINLIRWF